MKNKAMKIGDKIIYNDLPYIVHSKHDKYYVLEPDSDSKIFRFYKIHILKSNE